MLLPQAQPAIQVTQNSLFIGLSAHETHRLKKSLALVWTTKMILNILKILSILLDITKGDYRIDATAPNP